MRPSRSAAALPLLLACAFACCIASVAAAGELYAVQPEEMADDFAYKGFTGNIYGELSLFGVDRDEAYLQGRLNIDVAAGNEYGCAAYGDSFLEPLGDQPVPVFALVARGMCSFGQKVYYAQRAGASAMIVYNMKDAVQFPLPHMTPGSINASTIDIPGMLINYENGRTLLSHVKEWHYVTNFTGAGVVNETSPYYNGAWVSLTYSMIRPDSHVEWDLYTSPDDAEATKLVESLQPVVAGLGDRASFTPHYRVADGTKLNCVLPRDMECSEENKDALPCGNQCTNCGRYCRMNAGADIPPGAVPTGSDVIFESVRQKCLWSWGSQNAQPLVWWRYADAIHHANCSTSAEPLTCSEQAMVDAKVPAAAQTFVNKCQADTGMYVDSRSDVMEAELQWAFEWVPLSSPALFVNEFSYAGGFDCPAPASLDTCEPLQMICRAFATGTEPAVCSATGCEGGVARDACGVCGGTTTDSHDCGPSKGFPLGGIIAIIIVVLVVIGVGAACYIRVQNGRMKKNLAHMQDTAEQHHAYAAPPVRPVGDTAHASGPNGQFWQ